MKWMRLAAMAAAFVAAPAMADEESAAPESVEVMVLGVYHFANPGLDVVNFEVDDVLAPRRQREIQILVEALGEWRPTKIAVENMAEPPSLAMTDYARTADLLKSDRNESIQI